MSKRIGEGGSRRHGRHRPGQCSGMPDGTAPDIPGGTRASTAPGATSAASGAARIPATRRSASTGAPKRLKLTVPRGTPITRLRLHRRLDMESGSPRPSRSPAMLHDLPAASRERRAWGKAARKRARRGTPGYWAEEDRRHHALETILAPEPDPGPGTGSHPASADGGLAVELLPGRRGGHGGRPGLPVPGIGRP